MNVKGRCCFSKITRSDEQGCPQEVKSQDRDGQHSRLRRDWNVPFSQTLKTEMRHSTFKTEMFQFFKLSRVKTETRPRHWTLKTETRPRCSIFPNSQDRDETFILQDRDIPKKHFETASRPRHSRPRLHPWVEILAGRHGQTIPSQFLEWDRIEPLFCPSFSDWMSRHQSEKRGAFSKNLHKIIQNPQKTNHSQLPLPRLN